MRPRRRRKRRAVAAAAAILCAGKTIDSEGGEPHVRDKDMFYWQGRGFGDSAKGRRVSKNGTGRGRGGREGNGSVFCGMVVTECNGPGLEDERIK